jgi:hypothetical protein
MNIVPAAVGVAETMTETLLDPLGFGVANKRTEGAIIGVSVTVAVGVVSPDESLT